MKRREQALLSDVGVRFRKTHDIGALMSLAADAGHPLPAQCVESKLQERTPPTVEQPYLLPLGSQ
jgi:hypothetical protein